MPLRNMSNIIWMQDIVRIASPPLNKATNRHMLFLFGVSPLSSSQHSCSNQEFKLISDILRHLDCQRFAIIPEPLAHQPVETKSRQGFGCSILGKTFEHARNMKTHKIWTGRDVRSIPFYLDREHWIATQRCSQHITLLKKASRGEDPKRIRFSPGIRGGSMGCCSSAQASQASDKAAGTQSPVFPCFSELAPFFVARKIHHLVKL